MYPEDLCSTWPPFCLHQIPRTAVPLTAELTLTRLQLRQPRMPGSVVLAAPRAVLGLLGASTDSCIPCREGTHSLLLYI